MPSTYTLSGFLYNNAGTAVSGATVNTFKKNTTTGALSTTTTDTAGYWALSPGSTATEMLQVDVQLTNAVTGAVRRVKYDDVTTQSAVITRNLHLSPDTNQAGSSAGFFTTLAATAMQGDSHTVTFPDATGTLPILSFAQTWSAIQTHSADIIIQDASDLTLGDSSDALLRWSTGDASNHALVLGLGDTSQQLHITDKAAIATDWARSAGTHPELAIHSNTTPATDYLAIGNHDGTTASIDVVGGTTLDLRIAGTDELQITAAGINTNGGTITGTTISATLLTASTSLALATGATVTGIDNGTLGTSATLLATQGAIKTYVDAQVTAQDLDFQGDSGGALSIDLDSETLDIAGGTGIDTVGNTNTVTVAIDSTVATLAGSQTLTNKSITAPTITGAVGGTQDSATITALTISSMAGNWTNASRTVADMGIVTTIDINGGTIDNTAIGGSTPAAVAGTTGTFSGIVDITLVTDATDATGDTGALRTEGGASIAKKLYVGSDLNVTGNATITGTTTLNGTLVLGDAAADTLDITASATVSTDFKFADNVDIALGTNADILIRHSDAVSANAEVTDIIIGTSVHPGVAANSLLASNITASGDMMFATNRGGNTEAHMLFDASAGDTFLYARGVEALKIAGGGAMTITPALTVTGLITANGGITFAAGADIAFTGGSTTNDITLTDSLADALSITRGGTDMVVFDSNTPRITFTPVTTFTGAITASGGVAGDVTGDLTGNADTATALATGRTIAMTGDVTWTSASFTGAGNVTGAGTIADNAVTLAKMAGIARGKIIYGDASGNPAVLASGTANQVLTMTDGDDFDWADSTVGDITSVVAGAGMTGGATTGAATVNVIGGDGIAVAADAVAVDLVSNGGLEFSSGELRVATGISQYDVAQFAASVADNDFLRIDGTAVEGLSAAEVAAAIEGSIDAVGTIASGTWQGTAIASAYIAGDAITGAKIADDAIDSEHYTDGSIDNAHIADDAINSEHYAAGSIDTAHIADNQVTLAKMAGIARGKLIYGDSSGNPAVLAVGSANEVLTHDGTDFGWAAAGGGGLTYATQYRLSADTTRGLLTSNWEAPDTEGYGALGTAVGESSGIFSFPGTGYWLITFTATGGDSGDQQANYIQAEIHTTSDNSSYTVASFSRTHPGFGNPEAATTTTSFLFDVTNISNDKVKLKGYTSHTDWTIRGDTGQNETHVTFIHLGDT